MRAIGKLQQAGGAQVGAGVVVLHINRHCCGPSQRHHNCPQTLNRVHPRVLHWPWPSLETAQNSITGEGVLNQLPDIFQERMVGIGPSLPVEMSKGGISGVCQYPSEPILRLLVILAAAMVIHSSCEEPQHCRQQEGCGDDSLHEKRPIETSRCHYERPDVGRFQVLTLPDAPVHSLQAPRVVLTVRVSHEPQQPRDDQTVPGVLSPIDFEF
mmetsp:Transcript_5572/g.15968  ORF Transcript_5572/g.15968 Transcript_5572/m.15968 type:complete len:212 (-) Transcript_5572:7-642(-)